MCSLYGVYGFETWELTELVCKKIKAFEIGLSRWTLKMS